MHIALYHGQRRFRLLSRPTVFLSLYGEAGVSFYVLSNTGRELAKAGILMMAEPEVDDFYRQEFARGDAEDMVEVISTAGSATLLHR